MIAATVALLCAAALGAVLRSLRLPVASSFILGAAVLGWLLWPDLGLWDVAALVVLAQAAGASALGLRGAALGLGLAALGGAAWCWRPLLQAIGQLSFAGRFFGALLPVGLLGVSALCAAALLHQDARPYRLRVWTAALLLWAGSPWLLERYLRATWDYGAGSLSQAADIPPAGATEASTVLALRSEVERGRRLHAVGRLDAGPVSLRRVRDYLEKRGFRSLYKREGLELLRRGWAGLWEADRALEAAALHVPGEVVPDYPAALSLLRAGPITGERRLLLDRLHELALTVKGGFEDVNRSQRIFEGFHAAYAHFGDEDRSRQWILRVDDLWPLYEKKIEVVQMETVFDGVIRGRLLLDGRPASSVKVGLFMESVSEATGRRSEELSASVYPDSDGRFEFADLGGGTYFLQLLGHEGQLGGLVRGAPGFIDIHEASRLVELGAIMLERRRPAGIPPPDAPPRVPRLLPQVR